MKLVTMSASASPATMPSSSEPRMSARNGWTFSQMISTTTMAMPSSAAMTSCGCARRLVGGGEKGHDGAS